MDKIKVNNQVVKMRKHVKRAKLFAINKYTKQIKQLQNKKGNDSQAEKNQRKVERMLEKVKILKKMMPDFVSKKALSKAQNWNTLLAQKNIPLEDQCLALLANDSEVQKEVEKFHAEECHLVEKIPTLLLEWEVKSKMPKSPDRKKKASDIKKQKLDKIAKRRKSNFKGATFPNNVAVDNSLKASNHKKRMLSENSNEEIEDANEKNQNENLELMENDNDQNSESSDNSGDGDAEEFFTKTADSKKHLPKKRVNNSNTSGKSVRVSDHKKMHSEDSNLEDSDVNEENQNENSEPMEDDLNYDDQFNSESSNNSGDSGSEEFFSQAVKSKKRLVKNNTCNAQSTKDSPSNVNSSNEEESRDSSKDNTKNSISPEIEATDDSATSSQPSMFKRLLALANRDTTKLKAKTKSNSRNTKAIKVLDLNELQGSEQIPIQNSHTHSEEPETPQAVVPKKDSFFLNGDEEVQSSDDDESNTNNYRQSQPKRKFPNFDRNARDSKFKRNSFGDKPRFNSFKEKDFNRNENQFQNKKGRDFNRNENRFQNKGKDFNRNENRFQNKGKDFKRNDNRFQNKGKDFNRTENRFQKKKEDHFNRKENRFEKNTKGDFQFKNTKKFDSKPKINPRDDSFNQRRENKNSTMSNSFQSKKPTTEKGEKNVNLHPSWEAKNKLKEAAKSGFKGKRIVFD